MPYKNKEDQRRYAAQHYQRNKEKYIERSTRSRKELRKRNQDFIREYKESHQCTDCGIRYHYSQMDLDHIKDKQKNISRMVNSSQSIKTIMEEMAKCDLVCANCHRLRTWSRSQGG